MVTPSVEQTELERFVERWFEQCASGMAVGLVYLGDRLGLFGALRETGPVTSAELATHTGLVERYLREWLAAMAASGLLEYSASDQRYALNPEQTACFADPESLTYLTPSAAFVVKNVLQADRLATAFRNGGGVPFDAYGAEFTTGMDDISRPQLRAKLASEWLPAIPGVVEKLRAGGAFLDVGCGGGVVCVEVARAFPRASVVGVDRHAPSIERARANALEAGVEGQTRFEAVPIQQLPGGSFDLITSFDVVHDLPDPITVLRSIRALLKPDGSYVVVEGRGTDRLEQGSLRMRLGYGYSMFHCLPQSMSDGGIGQGGMLRESVVRELATAAGFSKVTVLGIEDPVKIFYHLTP